MRAGMACFRLKMIESTIFSRLSKDKLKNGKEGTINWKEKYQILDLLNSRKQTFKTGSMTKLKLEKKCNF